MEDDNQMDVIVQISSYFGYLSWSVQTSVCDMTEILKRDIVRLISEAACMGQNANFNMNELDVNA